MTLISWLEPSWQSLTQLHTEGFCLLTGSSTFLQLNKPVFLIYIDVSTFSFSFLLVFPGIFVADAKKVKQLMSPLSSPHHLSSFLIVLYLFWYLVALRPRATRVQKNKVIKWSWDWYNFIIKVSIFLSFKHLLIDAVQGSPRLMTAVGTGSFIAKWCGH